MTLLRVAVTALLFQTTLVLSPDPYKGKVDVDENLVIQPLKPEEVQRIKQASYDLGEAEARYNGALYDIRHAHGDNSNNNGWMRPCPTTITTVEIRGKYALILTKIDTSSCPVPAMLTASPKDAHN